MITVLLLALLGVSASPCSAQRELARAAAAYRGMDARKFTQTVQVRVPGAPVHEEKLDFDLEAASVVMSMPSLYTIELRGDRFRVVQNERPGVYVSAPAGRDLQASLDAAFGGAGSPLIPPTVLLWRARTPEERLQAFRMKLLGNFGSVACRDGEVTLKADNGAVRFRVDGRGMIGEVRASVSTAPGRPAIQATLTLTPREGRKLAFEARGRAVQSVPRLRGLERVDEVPRVVLKDLDGHPVRFPEAIRKTTVLEFWATWCAPCRSTLPRIAKFARSHGNVRVLLVDLSEDGGRIRPYLAGAGIDLPTLVDSDGTLHRVFGGGLPLTVVVSPDGRVMGVQAGYDRDIVAWLEAHTGG